jgi:LemA protein
LSATQSRLAFACQSFNVAVAQFNAAQVQFPTLLLARLFGFAPAVALQLGPSRA